MAYRVVIWKVFFDSRIQSSPGNSKYVKSLPFSISYPSEAENAKNLMWNLTMYPDGVVDNEIEKSIGIFTRCKNFKFDGVRTEFDFLLTISLLDRDGNVMVTDKKEIVKDDCKASRHHGFSNFATRAWINVNRDKLIVNNQLTFRAELTLYDNEKVLNYSQLNKTMAQLSVYKSLFSTGELSDLILVSADNKELKTHRVILMCHSNVFRKMLEKDMQNHRLEIPEFDSKILSELVQFIYTKKTENNEEIVFDLYRAADHFQVLDLKRICHNVIMNNLSIGNVLESIQFAEDTVNKILLKKCFGLIKNNWGLIRDKLDRDALTPEQILMIVDYLCMDIAEVRLNDK